jgi:hypothetical protein
VDKSAARLADKSIKVALSVQRRAKKAYSVERKKAYSVERRENKLYAKRYPLNALRFSF